MNVDIHVYQKRDGQWSARITCAAGRIYVNPCNNLQRLMEQVTRVLLLKNWDA